VTDVLYGRARPTIWFVNDGARAIASRAPLAVRVLKWELQSLTGALSLTADQFEQLQSARSEASHSGDLVDGSRAFFGKRPPVFRGQ
jgi:methylmalonyl-CoA decarboxylase